MQIRYNNRMAFITITTREEHHVRTHYISYCRRIATLTLNRPKVLNAINYDLLKELDELLDQAAADDSLRVLILTGSGKAFAAGADIAQQAGMDQEEAAKWGRYGSGIFRTGMFPDPDSGSSQRLCAGWRM